MRDTKTKKQKALRIIKNITIGLVSIILLLAIIGWIYERSAQNQALNEYPAPGKLVQVDENVLHILTMGNKRPTVVVEAGLGSWSLSWNEVQKEISKYATVVTYDRAGLGWSEEGHTSRTGDQVITELNVLLKKTGHEGPYIFIGHSMGSLYTQLYANKYPDEVAGMILVDTRPPNFENEFPEMKDNYANQAEQMKLFKFLSNFGIVRLLSGGAIHPSYSEENKRINQAIGFQGVSFDAIRNEMLAMDEVDQEVLAIENQPDVPVTVISHGIPEDMSAMGLTNDQVEQSWQMYQQQLADSFRISQLLIAEDSRHNIMLEQPEIIIESTKEMMEQLNLK